MSITPVNTSTDLNNYTGSLYEGNYIWTGAMNLCWTNLSQAVIHEPISLKTDEAVALAMVDKFNHPVCTTHDLDEPSYFIKAGMGQKTVDEINKESRQKFPLKSFADLDMTIGKDEFISYAYFFKKVVYEKPFTLGDMYFGNSWVKAFKAEEDQKRTVEILKYEDDNKFIIRLRLKTTGDELILVKGYNTQQPAEVLAAMNALGKPEASRLAADDQFMMPLLHLNYRRDYNELIGKAFANPGFTHLIIGAMFENINFDLDEAGAKVESQAVMTAERGAAPKKTGRYFFLDKPFWVIMKRSESNNPYFLLGVNNDHVMQKK